MVSLSVKYDIVRSDIQKITPVLNLIGVSSWKSGLRLFWSVKLMSTRKFRIANNQFWKLQTYLSLSIGQNLLPDLVRLTPVDP